MRVELFGIPRHTTGVATVDISPPASTLGDLLHIVGTQLPTLEGTILNAGTLQPGYLANINGQRFVSDPSTPLNPSETILILSSDVGG